VHNAVPGKAKGRNKNAVRDRNEIRSHPRIQWGRVSHRRPASRQQPLQTASIAPLKGRKLYLSFRVGFGPWYGHGVSQAITFLCQSSEGGDHDWIIPAFGELFQAGRLVFVVVLHKLLTCSVLKTARKRDLFPDAKVIRGTNVRETQAAHLRVVFM
jgi:hypothetical protein